MTISMQAQDRDTRAYGWLLVFASAGAIMLSMAHPRPDGHALGETLQHLAAGAAFNGWVHGALMALELVLVAGHLGLSRRLGLDRPVVTSAMVAYAFGAMAMMGAAVINGFAAAVFAGRYAMLAPDQVEPVRAALAAIGSIARCWATIAAVASSGAILLWSIALVALRGACRAIGLAGMLLGIATAALLIAGMLVMNVHGLIMLVLTQAIWAIAVGVQMTRGAIAMDDHG
jgi:hypothetical protein